MPNPAGWTPEDEAKFKAWYLPLAKRTGIDTDPDNPDHHYDYRAAYKAGETPDAEGHWPSSHKTAGHPRRYMSPDGKTFSKAPEKGYTDTKTGAEAFTDDDLRALLNDPTVTPEDLAALDDDDFKRLDVFANEGTTIKGAGPGPRIPIPSEDKTKPLPYDRLTATEMLGGKTVLEGEAERVTRAHGQVIDPEGAHAAPVLESFYPRAVQPAQSFGDRISQALTEPGQETPGQMPASRAAGLGATSMERSQGVGDPDAQNALIASGQPQRILSGQPMRQPGNEAPIGELAQGLAVGIVDDYASMLKDPLKYGAKHPILFAMNALPLFSNLSKLRGFSRASANEMVTAKEIHAVKVAMVESPEAVEAIEIHADEALAKLQEARQHGIDMNDPDLVARANEAIDKYTKLKTTIAETAAEVMTPPPSFGMRLSERLRLAPDEDIARAEQEIADLDAQIEAASKKRGPKARVEGIADPADYIETPEDVVKWIRASGGIAASKTSEIQPGSQQLKNLPRALVIEGHKKARAGVKGGQVIERYADALVEAGWFDDPRAAQDWIDEALSNPTGTRMPTQGKVTAATEMGERRGQAEAFLSGQQKIRLEADAALESVAARAKAEGLIDADDPVAAIRESTPEAINADELVEGERVLALNEDGVPDIFKVTPEPDGSVSLKDGTEITLSPDEKIEGVRLGVPKSLEVAINKRFDEAALADDAAGFPAGMGATEAEQAFDNTANRLARDAAALGSPGALSLVFALDEEKQKFPAEHKPGNVWSDPGVIFMAGLAGVAGIGLYAFFKNLVKTPGYAAAVKQAGKQALSLDKRNPADFENLFRTITAPWFPDEFIEAGRAAEKVKTYGLLGGVTVGAAVGSRFGTDEFSPTGASLGAALGGGVGLGIASNLAKVFQNTGNMTWRRLYDVYMTERAGLTEAQYAAKTATRLRIQGRQQELIDFGTTIAHLGPSDGALIHGFANGSLTSLNLRDAIKAGTASPKLLDLAVRWRFLTDELTLDLLDSGTIKDQFLKDTMLSRLGTYIPQLYLKHELSDVARSTEIVNTFLQTLGKRSTVSARNYIKRRGDIPRAVQEAMGIIEDNPGYLLAKRGAMIAADVEMSRYHRMLLSMPGTAVPEDVIKELGLGNRAFRKGKFKKLLTEKSKVSGMKQAVGELGPDDMLPGVDKALAESVRIGKTTTKRTAKYLAGDDKLFEEAKVGQFALYNGETYMRIPDNPRYGLLRGRYLEKTVADDIMGQAHVAEHVNKGLDQFGGAFMQYWKEAKVVMNPASRFRDLFSGAILADVNGGVSPWRIDKWYAAAKSLLSQDQHYIDARRAGVFGGQWVLEDVQDLLHAVNPQSSGIAETINTWTQGSLNKTRAYFQRVTKFEEDWARFTVYRNARESMGMGVEEAVAFSRRAIPDFSEMPKFLQIYKNKWFGAPFVSFSYKALPRMMEAAVALGDPKKAFRFWKYPFAMAAVNEYSAQKHGWLGDNEQADFWGTAKRLAVRTGGLGSLDPDSYNTVKKFMPSYLGAQQVFMPYRDVWDRPVVFDATFIVPWGDATEFGRGPLGQSLGRFGGAIPKQVEPGSNPFLQMAMASANKFRDTYSGKDIIPVGTEPGAGWPYAAAYMMKLWGPSLLSPSGYAYENFRKAVQGNPQADPYAKTLHQAIIGDFFGVKLRPVDPLQVYLQKLGENNIKVKQARGNFLSLLMQHPDVAAIFEDGDEAAKAWRDQHPTHAITRSYEKISAVIGQFRDKYPEPPERPAGIKAFIDNRGKKK